MGTSNARNENLRPLFNTNIPPISGKYGLRNHFWPLESCFLMRKSEKWMRWLGGGGWLLIQGAVIPFTLIAAPPINLFSFSQSQPTSLTLIGCTSSSILIFGNLARETIPHIIKLNRRSPVRQLSSAPQQERSAEEQRVKLSSCAIQGFLGCFGDFECQNVTMSKRLVEKCPLY